MSGHSKWVNIKKRKEAVDSQKAKIFSKLGKEITVAVKTGGGPDMQVNNKLKDIVAKAKANNMPNDNITRCIQKAAGEANSANYEEITYEGFGPFGVSVIVRAMTDNRNRAAADIRCIFDRAGGTLGQTGSVSYMFEKKGYFLIEKKDSIDIDTLMLEVIDQGADDIDTEGDYIEIYTTPDSFNSVKSYLDKNNYECMEADIRPIATIKKQLDDEQVEKFQEFVDKLEASDDVEDVWYNVDM